MGRHYRDGYSADIEGFLVVEGERFRVAKSNSRNFSLAEPCAFPPATDAELLVIVDGSASSRLVTLPTGVAAGQVIVEYTVAAPF